MNYCKDFLKAFRKTVGAKPEEKIDKRYKPYLAPNNKYYDNSHCGYCAEVEYLSEIYPDENEVNEIQKLIKKIERLIEKENLENLLELKRCLENKMFSLNDKIRRLRYRENVKRRRVKIKIQKEERK